MTDNDLPLVFLFLLSGSSSGEQLVTTVRETRRLSSHDVVFHVFHSLLFFAIFVLFAIYLCCFLHTFTMFESNVRLLHSRRLMTGSALVRYAWESVDWMLCRLLIISAEISQWTKCLMLFFFSFAIFRNCPSQSIAVSNKWRPQGATTVARTRRRNSHIEWESLCTS